MTERLRHYHLFTRQREQGQGHKHRRAPQTKAADIGQMPGGKSPHSGKEGGLA